LIAIPICITRLWGLIAAGVTLPIHGSWKILPKFISEAGFRLPVRIIPPNVSNAILLLHCCVLNRVVWSVMIVIKPTMLAPQILTMFRADIQKTASNAIL